MNPLLAAAVLSALALLASAAPPMDEPPELLYPDEYPVDFPRATQEILATFEREHAAGILEANRALLMNLLRQHVHHGGRIEAPPLLMMPQAEALIQSSATGNLADLTDDLADDKDKRGSYMSLCHFKICNMGRKRTVRSAAVAMRGKH